MPRHGKAFSVYVDCDNPFALARETDRTTARSAKSVQYGGTGQSFGDFKRRGFGFHRKKTFAVEPDAVIKTAE